jgi:hypothetical protein
LLYREFAVCVVAERNDLALRRRELQLLPERHLQVAARVVSALQTAAHFLAERGFVLRVVTALRADDGRFQ